MKRILIGERYRERLGNALVFHGFDPIWLPEHPNLDPRLASHADLSVFRFGSQWVLSEHLIKSEKIVNQLTIYECSIQTATTQKQDYPQDAGLCAAVIGHTIIHRKEISDPAIRSIHGAQFINIKQGYARCAVCTVDDNSIITADAGIAKAAAKENINVLKIRSQGFQLEGFREGFIGGSTFSDIEHIYFTGTLENQPDQSGIEDFIRCRGKTPIYLTSEPAFDIGSAFVLD